MATSGALEFSIDEAARALHCRDTLNPHRRTQMTSTLATIDMAQLDTVNGGAEQQSRENMLTNAIHEKFPKSNGYSDVLVGKSTFSGETGTATVQTRGYGTYEGTCSARNVVQWSGTMDPVQCTGWRRVNQY
jgi:hypothetical protein